MGQNILIPVTGSERSKEALDYALEQFPDANVTALHVLTSGGGDIASMGSGDPSPFHRAVSDDDDSASGDLSAIGPGGEDVFGGDESMESDEEVANQFLAAVKAYAEKRGADIETELMRGNPHRAIVKQAENGDYDMVVIGNHGRDGIARVLLGSVAEKVVRRSPVPVLVVR